MYYVYMLRCEDNSLYTGITTDVLRRFSEHKDGGEKGAKYTRAHKPIRIEAVWEVPTKSVATRLECRIKKLTKPQKELLIANELDTAEFFETEIKRISV